MLSREACERRVYRLAALVLGHPAAATAVIEAVLAARPDVSTLDGVHLDRLTLLRTREIPSAILVSDEVPLAVAQRLAALPMQQREAWVLARVYATPPRDAARSMDCSFHAFQQHLQAADAAMMATDSVGGAVVPGADAVAALRAWSRSLDLPEVYQRRRMRRQAVKRTLAAALLLALVLAAIIAAMIW